MITKRVKVCLVMLMIVDGVVAVVEPRLYQRLGESGPRWWRAMFEPLSDRPTLIRCVGAAEVALGVWFALEQGKSQSEA
jgi:uncharacterized protein YjeT (DUF2065 family)